MRRERGLVRGDRYADVRCDECDCELEPVKGIVDVDEQGRWDGLYPEGGLGVELRGWYAGYIDPGARGMPRVTLCRDCAARLETSFGSIGRALREPRRS